jgi:ComEC/Rec2-related protein
MKRPFIAVTLLYCAGVLLGGLPVPLPWLFALAFLLVAVFPFSKSAGRIILAALLVVTGWINEAQRAQIISPDDLRTLLSEGRQLAVIRGCLEETPRRRAHKIRDREIWSSTASISVTQLRLANGPWQPAFGKVMTETGDSLPESFFAGQEVEISGVLMPSRGPVAEGLFDYGKFLAQQGIYHELTATGSGDWKIISSPAKPPLADRFCQWARDALALGLPEHDLTLQLEWALTLGWKAAMTEDVSEPFFRASTYHIFAVDGLRIAIVSGIFLTFFRALGMKRAVAAMLTIPIILFYASLTGWPASAVRAIVMICIVFGGWILKRPGELLNSLFAAAMVILILDPRQMFQAGFRLSFLVVLCIILILPFFESLSERLLQTDPMRLPDSLPPWQETLRSAARHTLGLFTASIAAWLGSIPLVAYYFHLITPMSGPANLFAVPLCMLVLICNLASLLVVSWAPYFAVLFNHSGWFFMEGIRVTTEWSARWPAAYYYVRAPEWHSMVLYYALLLAVFTGWLFAGNRKPLKISAAILLVVADIFICWHQSQKTTVTFLPLGSSYCVYATGLRVHLDTAAIASDLRSPRPTTKVWGEGQGEGQSQRSFDSPLPNPPPARSLRGEGEKAASLAASGWPPDCLIDCGNDYEAARVLKPFLQAQGVNHLGNLVLTHGEIAYAGGAALICSNFSPRNILASPLHYRSQNWREFLGNSGSEKNIPSNIKSGDRIGPWTILFDDTRSGAVKAGDDLMAMRGDFGVVRVLSLADLTHAGQIALMSGTNKLQADILAIAASRTREDFPSDSLLDRVKPQIIILADSKEALSNRDREEFQRKLTARNITLLLTSETDAVTLTIAHGQWSISTMNGILIEGLR